MQYPYQKGWRGICDVEMYPVHALRIVHHYYPPVRDLIEVFVTIEKENVDVDKIPHAVMEGRRRRAQHMVVG